MLGVLLDKLVEDLARLWTVSIEEVLVLARSRSARSRRVRSGPLKAR